MDDPVTPVWNLNKYTRDVAGWIGSLPTVSDVRARYLACGDHLRAALAILASERVLTPTQVVVADWFDAEREAPIDREPQTFATADVREACRRAIDGAIVPLEIRVVGTTSILQSDDRDSELEGLVEVSVDVSGELLAIRTRADAWVPHTLHGRAQPDVYDRNAPRLERCLRRIEAELVPGLHGERTKLAIVDGYRVTNLTFDDGSLFVPELGIDDVDGDTSTLLVDGGRTVLGKRLLAGAGDQVREGYLLADPTTRLLVTLTDRHPESYDQLRAQLAFDVAGIGALRSIGELPASGIPYDDALVEVLPAGRAALALAPLPERAVIGIGIAVAEVLARAHARALVVSGLCPEHVYVDAELGFTGLLPRSRRFVASAPQRMTGLRSYQVPYEPFETLALGKPAVAKSDVFALCAVLHVLATGKHPFGDELPEIMHRALANAPAAFPGSGALGKLLVRGFAQAPEQRPSAAELAELLRQLA